MASLLFLFSLLLLTTTTTTAFNSTTTTTINPTTTNTTATAITTATNTTTVPPINTTTTTNTTRATPINTTTITAIPPTPPPPPPPLFSPPPPPRQPEYPTQTPIQEAHFNTIIDAIVSAGDFSNWANLLSRADPSAIPISATLFVPDDDAFLDSSTSRPPSTPLNFLDPLLFPYHVIPHRFSFSELRLFPTGARLPTLLPAKTLLVTNNSVSNFTINGAKLTRPDLYQNGVVSVHGVGGFLDYALFGNDSAPPPRQSSSTTINDDDDDDVDYEDTNRPSPVTEFEVSGTGTKGIPAVVQVSSGSSSSSPQHSWINVVWSVIFTMFLLKAFNGLPGFEIFCEFERSIHPSASGGSILDKFNAGCTWKLV